MSHYQELPQAQVSSVAAHTQVVAVPFGCTNAMVSHVVGAGSGTVSTQFSGSNDGTNYTNIGSAVTATDRDIALTPNNEVWKYIKAVVTISTDTKEVDNTFYFN